MLTLKLQRIGKKHQASFRLIVGEKREKLDGKQLEDLGWFNPRADKMEVNKERAVYWLKQGAQKTDSVHNLLIRAGVIEGKKIAVHKQPKKPATADSSAKAPATAEATAGKKEGVKAEAPKADVSAEASAKADVSAEASAKAEAAAPAEQK